MTVHLVRLCEKRTMIASAAAIQQARRTRLVSSQRPALVEPCCTARGESLSTRSTVPRWCRQPGARDPLQRAPRGARRATVVEEAVHRRPGPADVGAEGA